MKPLIFAEPGLLPFNPGRAGVQVPLSRGLNGACPLWEPSLSAAVPGEPHGAPPSEQSPANIKLCCRGVVTRSCWGCCSVCLGENSAGEGQELREGGFRNPMSVCGAAPFPSPSPALLLLLQGARARPAPRARPGGRCPVGEAVPGC